MNPHNFFKDIAFNWTDNGSHVSSYTYTMLATTYSGLAISFSVVLPKDLETNVSDIESKLLTKLYDYIADQIWDEVHDAWMGHLYELKKEEDQYKKLAMMNPLNTGVIGHFHTGSGVPSSDAVVVSIDPVKKGDSGVVASIFDKKKNPKYVEAPNKLFNNELIDALMEMTLEEIDTHNHPSVPNMMSIALKTFPGLKTRIKSCPYRSTKWSGQCFQANNSTLADMILHLNDNHKYPREKIAEWLDTLDIDLSVPIHREKANAED